MRLAILLLTVLLSLTAGVATGRAQQQEETAAGSFITPFPEGDTYKVLLVGDSWAESMVDGLAEGMAGDQRVQIQRKHRSIPSLFRGEFDEDMRQLEESAQREKINIVVVMLGTQDRVPLRSQGGRRTAVGTDEWRTEYGRRIDRLMKAVRKPQVGVYWVGLPTLRRSDANEDAQMMNAIIRDRAYLNGVRYIDVYAGFTDETGEFNAYGPDLTGKNRLLRDQDGIGFTGAGARKLASFVEREVKRDVSLARSERTLPLAGTADEQARVNPQKVAAAQAAAAQAAAAQAAKTGQAPSAVPVSRPGAVPSPLEQKADNGKISVRSVGANGREETVTIDILRPAIPASVVALVTRKESTDKASQLGEALIDEAPGGLTLLTTISPAAETGSTRRKLSPMQTPYYRVLVKGERTVAKPGRADDFTWPRTDIAAPPEPAPTPAGAVPAPTSPRPSARNKSAAREPKE